MGDLIPSASIGDSLTATQKAKLHEVADGMLEIYRTLERMQYLRPSWIVPGPCNIDALLPLYRSLGLDDSIIYLYSILPYVEAPEAYTGFLHGGSFADFRNEGHVRQGRSPFYSEEEDEMLRPWMTPLSMLGNHDTVIIYNARTHWIGMIDHETGRSTDHNFHRGAGADGGLMEEEDKEEQGYWGGMDGRPAPDVLRDIVQWYEELIETPGSGDGMPAEWSGEWVKDVYRKHAWPQKTFDGEAFSVDLVRTLAADRVKESVEKPIMDVERQKNFLESYLRFTMEDAKTRLQHAQTVDEQWLARWEIHQTEKAIIQGENALREAEKKMEELCPGGKIKNPEDIPLLELQFLAREFRSSKNRLEWSEQRAKKLSTGDEAKVREMKLGLELVEREALIAQKAYEAARRDADRLCPGRSLPSDDREKPKNFPLSLTKRMADLNGSINKLTGEIHGNQEWLSKIPEEAVEARERVERYLRNDREWLEVFMKQREELPKAMGA